MKALLNASTLFVLSIIGVVVLIHGLQNFYAIIYGPIGQALQNVTSNLAGR